MLRIPNAALWWVVGGALVALLSALTVPFPQEVLRFGTPSALDLVLVAVSGALGLGGFESLKAWGSVESGGAPAAGCTAVRARSAGCRAHGRSSSIPPDAGGDPRRR